MIVFKNKIGSEVITVCLEDGEPFDLSPIRKIEDSTYGQYWELVILNTSKSLLLGQTKGDLTISIQGNEYTLDNYHIPLSLIKKNDKKLF